MTEITMPIYVLADLLKVAADLGSESAYQRIGLAKVKISKSAAYRKYGRNLVDKWEKDGRIKKEGGKWQLNPVELETLFQLEKRPFYSMIKQKK